MDTETGPRLLPPLNSVGRVGSGIDRRIHLLIRYKYFSEEEGTTRDYAKTWMF